MDSDFIPFNRASLQGDELRYIAEAVAAGHISGDGQFTQRCHEFLQSKLGARQALLTPSGTQALELAALLLSIGPGDEVIIPSFTFPSVGNAFALRGARIVFADIRADTLNLDETRLEDLVSDVTKAIVPAHYAGVACEMDAIVRIAGNHSVTVVEDNAHGLFGKYKNRLLGTIGSLSALSFHETKNFTCGEGGALLVNDERYGQRAEIVREKGTDRSRFFRGLVDRYSWVDIGSSYLPSDLLAAFLYAQLEANEQIQAKRRCLWDRYYNDLEDWADAQSVRLPMVPEHCEQSYHMFYLLLPSLDARQALIEHLRTRSIHSAFHYLPLHLSEMGRRMGGKPGDCPVTEETSDRLLRLPFFTSLSEADQRRVVAAVREFRT